VAPEGSSIPVVGEDFRRDPRRRLTIAQAADQLGISVDAMRARVKRGSVGTHREGGRVYVLLDAAQDAPETDRTDELIATLREQLAAERDANRENRRIIAALTSRIPELEAPSDERGASETAGEQQGRVEPRSATGEAQEAAEQPLGRRGSGTARGSLWRRIFGG
jgi:hypothetical protein